MTTRSGTPLAGLLVLTLNGMLPAAMAQEKNQALALEEVFVTAQKRTESLQDVPISIVAMDQHDLEIRAIDALQDISLDIPNFSAKTFVSDSSTVRLFIRGIGQNDAQITQDPSVALYLDGVYIGTSVGAGFQGVDVDRIEVLRGPQGTLYGRNATGGAVNIITRRADVESIELRQDLTYGNLDRKQSKTVVNVPLTDSLATKLAYYYLEQDGFIQNKGPGEDFSNQDQQTGVFDLRWLAAEEVTADYRFEYASIKDSEPFNQIVTDPADSAGILASLVTYVGGYSPDRLEQVTSQREIEPANNDIAAHSVWVEWEINDLLALQSISAYRKLDGFAQTDFLPTAVYNGGPPVKGRFFTDFKQWSQELQLLGDTDQWEYIAGLYYYRDEAYQANRGSQLGVSGLPDETDTENWSGAAYSQVTWNPAWMEQRWRFTLGGRYSYDERQADRDNQIAASAFTGTYSKDFSNFNPSLVVAYDLAENTNVYGKVQTGYKSGGTSTRSASAILFSEGFDEEDIFSTELGVKGEFWDGRARYNSAIFYMNIDGLQTSVQTDPISPGGRDFLPIDGNDIYGAEADLYLLVTEGLTWSFNYGYLDTRIGENSVTAANGLTEEMEDEMPYAPRNSLFTALDYSMPMGPGTLGFNVNYGWQDDSQSSPNASGNYQTDSYGLMGGAVRWSDISIGSLPGELRFLLWGRNLLDETYSLTGNTALQPFGADATVIFGEPRTYGLTVTYQY